MRKEDPNMARLRFLQAGDIRLRGLVSIFQLDAFGGPFHLIFFSRPHRGNPLSAYIFEMGPDSMN